MKSFLRLAALASLVLVVLFTGAWADDSAVRAESGSAAPAVAVTTATAANVPSGAAATDAKTFQEEAAAQVLPARPAALLIQTALDNVNRLELTEDQVKALTVLLAVAKEPSVPQSAVPAVVFPEGTPPAEAIRVPADDRENHLRVELMKILKGLQPKRLAGIVNKLPAAPATSATAPQSAAPASK